MRDDHKEHIKKIKDRVHGMGIKGRQYPEGEILWLIEGWVEADRELAYLRQELKDLKKKSPASKPVGEGSGGQEAG